MSTSKVIYCYISTVLYLFTCIASAYKLRQCPYSGHWDRQSVILNGYSVDPCEVSTLPEFDGIWNLIAPSDRDIPSLFFMSMIYTESKIVNTKILKFLQIEENNEKDVYDIVGPAEGKYIQSGSRLDFYFEVQAYEKLPKGEKGYFTFEVKFDGPDGFDGYCVYQYFKVSDGTEDYKYAEEDGYKDELG